jgi:hypothetical protein
MTLLCLNCLIQRGATGTVHFGLSSAPGDCPGDVPVADSSSEKPLAADAVINRLTGKHPLG